jgi:hypothetical protein
LEDYLPKYDSKRVAQFIFAVLPELGTFVKWKWELAPSRLKSKGVLLIYPDETCKYGFFFLIFDFGTDGR